MDALVRPLPFALPERIEPRLETLRRFWSAIRRGENEIPFADDLKIDQLSLFAPRLFTFDVRERPQRFRFDICGTEIARRYGEELEDRFLDELKETEPLEYLASQCCAAMQSCAPAWFATESYERLVLPMWGNGAISVLLGAFTWR